VILKVKFILLAEAQLQEVIIKGLLAHTDFRRPVLQGVSNQVTVSQHTVVESTPKGHLLDDLLDRALFGSLCPACLVTLRIIAIVCLCS